MPDWDQIFHTARSVAIERKQEAGKKAAVQNRADEASLRPVIQIERILKSVSDIASDPRITFETWAASGPDPFKRGAFLKVSFTRSGYSPVSRKIFCFDGGYLLHEEKSHGREEYSTLEGPAEDYAVYLIEWLAEVSLD